MKEIVITSSVLIVAVILLRLLFRNKVSRRLIYGAWLLVALRLLIPVQFGNMNFSVLSPVKPVMNSIADIAQRPVFGPSREEAYNDALKDYLSQGGQVFVPEVQERVDSKIQQGRPQQEVYDELLGTGVSESIVLPEISREIETKVSGMTAPTFGQLATVVWIVGMVVMAVWFAAVNLNFRRKLCKTAVLLELPESKIPVKVSPVLTSPCLFGFLKPTVYMTPGCKDDERMRHHVLTHEMTHLQNGDHIWAWVRCICLCIYWFNPLVWVAASLSRRDCELACDEAVLKELGEGERLAYGKTLLDMVSSVPAPGQLLETATAMHETKKQLKERMKCIVKKPKVFLTAAIILLVVLMAITGCTFSGAFDGPQAMTPDNTQTTTTVVQATTVSKEDGELEAFQKLFFTDSSERNPYGYTTGYEYSSPEEIILRNFFDHGFSGEHKKTDAEYEALKQIVSWTQWLDNADFNRLPKDKMEADLQAVYGVSLADLPDSAYEGLYYLESTDCYYSFQTAPFTDVGKNIRSVVHNEDGTISLSYEALSGTKYILTLKQRDDRYLVLSNARADPQGSTTPTTPSVTVPATTIPVKDPELAYFQDQFRNIAMSDGVTRNYYNYALGQEYASVMELDLREFFGNGFTGEKTATEAELAELQPYLENSFFGENHFHRLPKEKMEEELQKCFGITLEDLPDTAFESLIYLESSDSYCFFASSVHGIAEGVEIQSVEHLADGTLRVIYTKRTWQIEEYAVTLKPAGEGYLVLSNLKVE